MKNFLSRGKKSKPKSSELSPEVTSRLEGVRKRFRKILILFAVVGLLLLTGFFAFQSRNGDLFFTLKLAWEKTREPSSSQELLDYKASIISDRVEAYSNTAANSNCVQLLLVEEDLQREFISWYGQVRSLGRNDYISNLEKILPRINALRNTGSCQGSPFSGDLSHVLELEIINLSGKTDLLDPQIVKTEDNYETAKSNLQQAKIDNQDSLNQINQLILEAVNNLSTVKAADSKLSPAEKWIKIQSALFYLANADQLTAGQQPSTSNPTNWHYPVIASCYLNSASPKCQREELLSRWNSIALEIDPADRISEGEKLFLNIWNELKYKEQKEITSSPVSQ